MDRELAIVWASEKVKASWSCQLFLFGVFDRETFVAQSKRGEFRYTYDDIVKVIMTKQDFYILIGENTGFPIEKKNCTPEALEFLLELHIEHM